MSVTNVFLLAQKPPAASGRPRGFAPETALQHAMEVFWRKGFVATSLDDLLKAMALSKSSFYACFGSKHDAFMAAIESYADGCFDEFTRHAQTAPDPVAAVRAILASVANTDGGTRGCFFVNAVTELAPHDDALAAYCQSHIARVAELVTHLLVDAGFSPGLAAERAAGALALSVGVITLRKAGIPPQQVAAVLAQVKVLLDLPGTAKAHPPVQCRQGSPACEA
ncbi:MAG: TetR/AcrR family transcriptional regulator [Pseudomonadota bacterium]